MIAKQTGPRGRVKATASRGSCLILLIFALSACAGPHWRQAGHSAKETERDLARCERTAEHDTLQSMGTSRSGYDLGNLSGVGGGRSSQDPMALHDRVEGATRFHEAVADCMYARGYVDANATDRKLQR